MSITTELQALEPNHDYPAGLIHPYWARKPINIVEKLVESFSQQGDVVFDPFMGSGTSVLAALKLNRKAIGSDLNPLACLIVEAVLASGTDSEVVREDFLSACNLFKSKAIELYEVGSGLCVEREQFNVEGSYLDGNFSLVHDLSKLKPIMNGELKGRIQYSRDAAYLYPLPADLLHGPIDFGTLEFTENTRIAVHQGVTAKHFFTDRNIVFINFVTRYIDEKVSSEESKKLLRVFLSSLLPMLRLSDKKASSQWPYWRPKNMLTSRNPIVALKKREKAFLAMFQWVSDCISNPEQGIVNNCSASQARGFISGEVDLILTDPPYADHAPYLEYSDLFWSILSGRSTKEFWGEEIVKTNAVGRNVDASEYESRMKKTFIEMLSTLKVGGKFVFFYVDKNLEHWNAIKEALVESSCEVAEVIPLPKQRRSMKTVATPGKTLDGDLIVICEKVENKTTNHLKKALLLSDVLARLPKDGTYFQRFASFMVIFLKSDIIDLDKRKITDISRII